MIGQMHVTVDPVEADVDSFNRIEFVHTDEEKDDLVERGWTFCQTETAIVENVDKNLIGISDGVITMHVMGRNE